jgi:hypothetical protein
MNATSKLLVPLIAVTLGSFCALAFAQNNNNNETANTPPVNTERQNVSPADKTAARAQHSATGKEVAKDNVRNPQDNQSGEREMKPQAQTTTSEERTAARRQRRAEGAQVTKENIDKPKNNESMTAPPTSKP